MEIKQQPNPETHPTEALWALIFGQLTGYLSIFSGLRAGAAKGLAECRERYFSYPNDVAAAIAYVRAELAEGREVYFGGHLLNAPKRLKEHAQTLLALYADGDGARPPEAFPPSAVVETSPGRHQFFWRLSRPVDPAVGADLNRRLAYAMGADRSGWDLTQLLRLPGTINHKYPAAPEVRLTDLNDRTYDPDELAAALPQFPTPPTTSRPDGGGEPPVRLGAAAMTVWEGRNIKTTDDGEVDRSASLFRIGRVLIDNGAMPQTAIAALAERDQTLGWNKYTDRPNADEEYQRIVDKLRTEETPAARPTRTSGIRLVWADQLDTLPDLEWLIDGIAPVGGLGVMVGPPESGKTFLLLDIACCIATGTDWHGRAVRQGTVVYVYAEGVPGLRARFEAWKAAYGKDVKQVAFIRHAVNLLDPHTVDKLLANLDEERVRPVAIIFDTLARAMTGGDENGSKDMGLIVAAADRLQAKTGAAVWFAHHPKKGARVYRGSSALAGSADTIIEVDNSGTTITVRCEKQKDAQHFERFALELVESATSRALAPTAAGSIKPARQAVSDAARATLAALVAAGPSGLRHREWLPMTGEVRNVFNRHLKELKEAALIRKGGGSRNAPWVAVVAGDRSAEEPQTPGTTKDANCRCDEHAGDGSCEGAPDWLDDDWRLHCGAGHPMIERSA